MNHTQPNSRLRKGLFCSTLCAILIAGCQPDSVVFHEGVPKTRNFDWAEPMEPRFRMVTAIVDRPDATWFFKISGPLTNIDEVQDDWASFLDTIRFDSAEPVWKLPDSWTSPGFEDKRMPGGMAMRIANIATRDAEVAVSVSSMPAGQQILPNVNRWRGQLGLRPVNELQLATQLSRKENDQVAFRIFDAKGPQLTTRMGGAPFANGRGMSPGKPGPTTDPPDYKTTSLPINFTAPLDWQSGETSSMIVGRWSMETENGTVELLLMKMSPSDESWKMNVEAWSKQVKGSVAPVIEEITESIEVANLPAKQVRLNGPDSGQPRNPTVIAAMFENRSGDGFVLKLSGGQASVEQVEEQYQSLLDSIAFSGSDEN